MASCLQPLTSLAMNRTLLLPLALLALASLSPGQEPASAQRMPTALRNAGIYHPATGTWTRGLGSSAALGTDVIYRNDAASGYFSALGMASSTEPYSFIDSGRLPTADSSVTGATTDGYCLSAVEFAYCSELVTNNVQLSLWLYDSYAPCDLIRTAPSEAYSTPEVWFEFGLPGATSSGPQCWTVTIDLDIQPNLFLLGDGGPVRPGEEMDPDRDSFGIEWRFLNTAGSNTGPVVAGDPTWTTAATGAQLGGGGGTYYQPLEMCSNGSTGLDSQDFFALDDHPSLLNGCYFFGGYVNTNGCGGQIGLPFASFHTVLYADPNAICELADQACPAGLNSAGQQCGLERAFDPDSVSGFTFYAEGGVPGQAGIFIVSDATQPPAMISNGFLCLNGFGRMNGNGGPSTNSLGLFDANGSFRNLAGTGDDFGLGFRVPLELPAPFGGTAPPGSTWYYQLWYRDNPSQNEFNFSNLRGVTF